MTKPIRIPPDLKPGDIGVCRDGTRLMSMLDEGRNKFTEHAYKRIRAIARRLEGMKP